MSSRERTEISLEPLDGLTLERRTREEWGLGYMFKVLWCSTRLFRKGDTLTIKDIHNHQDYHDEHFALSFNTLTVAQYHQQKAAADYGYELAALASGVIVNHEEVTK
jgi:hypothetical protein